MLSRSFRRSRDLLRWRCQLHTASTAEIEEQTLPRYHQKRYYPVRPGELLGGRYKVITKLGYGAYSTVWLAKDERSNEYRSVKICIQDDTNDSPVLNEIKNLTRLKKFAEKADHPGLDFTRLATDMFEIYGPLGRHHCIASIPQGGSIRGLQELFPDARLPKLLVKSLLHRLLFSVNWLYATCGCIHTDISPQNILTQVDDEISFREAEEQELQSASIPVSSDGYPVYRSRVTMEELSGLPILTDFGQMRLDNRHNNYWWMSDMYRAPEVLFGLPWSFPVDIWSIGVMTLELMEGNNLFDPIDRINDQYVLPLPLAQYIAYLGPPPLAMIQQSPLVAHYFDSEGRWNSEPSIPNVSLESFVTTIPPGHEKELFLKFIRKLLTWDSEARATSNEAIEDEWLMTPHEE